MSITAALTQHAQQQGKGTAIVFGEQRLSWQRLDEHVHRLAAHLAAIANGQPVVLHLQNSPALLLLFLATARAGLEAHLFDVTWPGATLQALLGCLADPLVMTHDEELASRYRGVHIDPSTGFDAVADQCGAPSVFGKVAEPVPAQPFYVGFTSGSTGLPKGYRRSHASWLDGFDGEVAEFGLNAGDVALVPGPMAHSLAPYAITRALNAGAKVIFGNQFTPRALSQLIEREQVSILYCVPTQLMLILSSLGKYSQSCLRSVRLILCTGSKWPAEETRRLKQTFPAAEFCEFYGASELGYLTLAKLSENIPANSVGRPFPGVQIMIFDQDGRELGPNERGLVYVKSPLVFMSYSYTAEGRERRIGDAVSVGDVGYIGDDGLLYLVGRADRMIISAGKNIHPEEIEDVLVRHPSISRAAVLATPDALRGERFFAVLKLKEAGTASGPQIMAFAREMLPLHKVPRRYVLLDDWPTTPAGKTDFAKLASLASADVCDGDA